MARETTKWPSTRWPITKIMSSDGCNGNRVPLEMGPWYDFREFGCHLGNVGSDKAWSFTDFPVVTKLTPSAANDAMNTAGGSRQPPSAKASTLTAIILTDFPSNTHANLCLFCGTLPDFIPVRN